MHPAIRIVHDQKRGCGYRSTGRMYLVSDGKTRSCGKLPIPLTVCPCCGQGIRPSRAPQWLEHPERLWFDRECQVGDQCKTCPMGRWYETGAALLIWVGEKYYSTAVDFIKESAAMGISRHINAIPRGFVVGETWVLLAHRKAYDAAIGITPEPNWQPGIFGMFKPTRIEIIVTGEEPHEVIEGYVKRGLTPVCIYKPTDQPLTQEVKQKDLFADK